MKPKHTRLTAEELLKQRERDPEYCAQMQQLAEQRGVARAKYREAAAPLMAELAASGYEAESLDVLAQSKAYKDAIPLLIKWLPKMASFPVKQSIIKALSVDWAGPDAVTALLSEFRSAPDSANAGLKWAIGNALEVLASDDFFDEYVNLAQDKRHGIARQILVSALGKMENPKAVDVLLGFLDDEEVVGHALIGLKKLKAKEARPQIELLLNHPKAWIRKAAKEALVRMKS
jgi:hypothetical protein